jgi:hypothetical protein
MLLNSNNDFPASTKKLANFRHKILEMRVFYGGHCSTSAALIQAKVNSKYHQCCFWPGKTELLVYH